MLDLSLAARGLWVSAGAWCAQHLTDGKVSKNAVRALGGSPRLASELVAAGLWCATADGYEFHDWSKYQPSRESIEQERNERRDRQARWREERRKKDVPVTVDRRKNDASTDASPTPPQDTSLDVSLDASKTAARPVPSRPDPNSSAADEIPETLLPVTSDEVCKEWHRAAMQPGGNPSVLHGQSQWRTDYETVVAALGIVPEENRRIALRAVCEWFWLAPDGPIQTSRIDRMVATPFYLAKNISRDLKAANAWFASREAAQ